MKIYNNKQLNNYKVLRKLAFISFLANFSNFAISIFSAIASNTIVVWVDTLVSLEESVHCLLVFLIAHMMCKETGDRYNYGMGRLEVFGSFVCGLIVSLGMVTVIVSSIISIFNPTAPTNSLLAFCIIKVCNTAYDLVLYIKQSKVYKENPTKLNETEKTSYLIMTTNDAVMFVIVVICYFFRQYDFVQYFSPIASICLSIYFLTIFIKKIINNIKEISDVSISVDKQDQIYDIIVNSHNLIKRIQAVNCHTLNNKVYIDISLIMNDNATYQEMDSYLKEITEEIHKVVPDSSVHLVIGDVD